MRQTKELKGLYSHVVNLGYTLSKERQQKILADIRDQEREWEEWDKGREEQMKRRGQEQAEKVKQQLLKIWENLKTGETEEYTITLKK